MRNDLSEARARLASLAARVRRGAGPTPSLETLEAYLDDRLPAIESERIEDHLAASPDLAQELLELASFDDRRSPRPELALSSEELAADREMLLARLKIVPDRRRADRRRWKASVLWRSMAAGLAALSISLAGGWMAERRAVQRLQATQVEIPTVDLLPRGRLVRGESSNNRLVLPSDAEHVLITLTLDRALGVGRLGVAITSRRNSPVTLTVDRVDPEAPFLLLKLHRSQLPAGEVVIRLSRPHAGAEGEVLEEYAFYVVDD